jgi:hypothetical protein
VARVYRGRVEVSIEAVHRLHEPASLPTKVKEVLAMFGRARVSSTPQLLLFEVVPTG